MMILASTDYSYNWYQTKKRKVSNETYLWHLRLGHNNPNRIHGLVKSGILNSLAFEPIPSVNPVWKVK